MRGLSQPILIGLATLCVVGLVAVTVVLFASATTTADLLPSPNVIAYWRNVHTKEVESWKTIFPLLQDLPSTTASFDVAILQVEGKEEWVFFPSATDAALLSQAADTVQTHPFLASSPAIRALLGTASADTLADLDVFRELTRNTKDATVLFVDRKRTLMRGTGRLDRFLLFALGTGNYAAFVSTPSRLEVRTLSTVIDSSPAHLLPALSPPPTFALTVGAPADLWKAYLLASGEESVALEGRLAAEASRIFGDDVSLRYDLLPLLTRPALFLKRQNAAGNDAIFIEGEAENASLLQKTLDRIMTSMEASTMGMMDRPRIYEGKNLGKSLQLSGALLEWHKEQQNGWSVHTLQSPLLTIAVRGRSFIVSTDASWVTECLSVSAEIPMPALGLRMGGGLIDNPTLRSLLSDDPYSFGRLLTAQLPSATKWIWTVGRSGDMTTVTVEGK